MQRRNFVLVGCISSLLLGWRSRLTYGLTPSIQADQRVIVHTIFFQFKDGIAQDLIDDMFARIKDLGKKIPGIVDTTFGRNFSPRAKNFTHAVTIRFLNRAAIDAFYPHPAHQQLISESIKPIIEDLLPLDYENLA